MKKLFSILILVFALFLTAQAKAQDPDVDTFSDNGGTCSTFVVSHNGAAALNWVCQAPVTGGDADAASVSFSVVLNSDGSFTNGYFAFYNQAGQLKFAATNFTGTLSNNTFSGTFSGNTPAGSSFSGDATQTLAARTAVVRGARHTYYSIAAGSGGNITTLE